MRIAGFASGMDIDQIVKNLMAAHRKPLDRLFQNKQLMEWKREEYRKINTKMLEFRNSKLTEFRSLSNINAKQAVVSGDTSAISARASSGAANGTMTIKVDQLATSALVVSSQSVGTQLSADTLLSDLFPDQDFSTHFSINGVDFTFDPENDTIGSLIEQINNNKEAQASVFFDYASGQMSITSTATGAGSMTISSDGPGDNILIDGFHLTEHTAGQNAIITVNGISIQRESNSFQLNGVDVTLHGVSNNTSTITVGNDVDKIVDTIKSFVEEYNSLLEAVNAKLGEERFRTFLPLTAEQKKEMSEDEIKLWEEKSRSGMLRSDRILENMVNSLRLAIISDVGIDDDAVNITSLGIATGSWTERGKLVIDEERLRAAIEADPDKVTQVFTKQAEGASSDKGIFHRLSDILMDSLNEMSKTAGTSAFISGDHVPFSESSSMANEIRQIDRRMDDMNRKLIMLENRYFAQFTAMETAISRFNTQSSIFANFM